MTRSELYLVIVCATFFSLTFLGLVMITAAAIVGALP